MSCAAVPTYRTSPKPDLVTEFAPGPNLVAGEFSAFDDGDGWVLNSARSCGGRDRIWELAPLCGCCIPRHRGAGFGGYKP